MLKLMLLFKSVYEKPDNMEHDCNQSTDQIQTSLGKQSVWDGSLSTKPKDISLTPRTG